MNVQGAQGFVEDPRNERVLVHVNGELLPRADAKISVFDSGFVLGDGVWEAFRLVNGTLVFMADHLQRLFEGARAIDLDIGLTGKELADALYETVDANGMRDGAHVRLMVTRGMKHTPNQDPRYAVGRPTIVIIAVHKQPSPEIKASGLHLFTSTIRCSPPDVYDLRLNSHSRLNLIQALIQAIKAGAHEALMLDPLGFVASCNSTNFFIVRGGEVWTSTGRFNFKGITRRQVIELCERHAILVRQTDFTLAECYAAEEAFVTGTFGGVTPVSRIDGRMIGRALPGSLTNRVAGLYAELVTEAAARGRSAWPPAR
jgi:branched-chain amino acid aminotransferase